MEYSENTGRDSEEGIDYSRRRFFGFAAGGLAAAVSGCGFPKITSQYNPPTPNANYVDNLGGSGIDHNDNANGNGSGNGSGAVAGVEYEAKHTGGDGVGAR